MDCVDESMSSWLGADGANTPTGMPHVTKIPRKPKGVGLEFKCVADVSSGIMLGLEIHEGKDAMAEKEFAGQYQKHVATTLRLVKPYFGSTRTVFGDSWFGSVTCAEALKEHGMYSIFVVKTAVKRFPKRALLAQAYPTRGHSVAMEAVTASGVHITAMAWRDFSDAKAHSGRGQLKTIVGTAGTSAVGEAHIKKRYCEGKSVEISVTRPQMYAEYYGAAQTIDVHNHHRQGILALEVSLATKVWWKRVYASVLGMIETNAFLAYLRMHPRALTDPRHTDLTHKEFTSMLAYSLVTNSLDNSPSTSLRPRQDRPEEHPPCFHTLSPLWQTDRKYAEKKEDGKKPQLTCSVCKKKRTALACATCWSQERKVVALCSFDNAPNCVLEHNRRV